MPELASDKRARYVRDFELSEYEAHVLTENRDLTVYFEQTLAAGLGNRKATANWVMTEVLRLVNESGKPLAEAAPAPSETGALLRLVETAAISLNAAKTAFAAMHKSGNGAAATVAELGLAQVSDEAAIGLVIDQVLAAEAAKVAEYRGGRDKLFGYFVGQVMKAMAGKGNPKLVNEILRAKLAG